ncbi:hypothetical protein IAR50_001239 [Cryptococcus sp. DSM 104548]
MPTSLSHPNLGNTKSYTPLADERHRNGHPSAVARNGAVFYNQRASSIASTSTISGDLPRAGMAMRNDSEETLSPVGSRKGKERAIYDEGVDIGDVQRSPQKGKARAWDVEQGRQSSPLQDPPANGVERYPPISEAEEEERRIQEHLSRLAAKDTARRLAARNSKMLPPSPAPASSPRSSGSFSLRRPLSMLTSAKRGSVMGSIDGLFGRREEPVGELPMTRPQSSETAYTNPYDSQPPLSPVPRPIASPISPTARSPFADPFPPPPTLAGNERRPSLVTGISTDSPRGGPRSLTSSPAISPTEETGFAYGGPTWRGGQGVRAQAIEEEAPRRGPDRWWHALCAWGDDLDGGHDVSESNDGQKGRTNPFE